MSGPMFNAYAVSKRYSRLFGLRVVGFVDGRAVYEVSRG